MKRTEEKRREEERKEEKGREEAERIGIRGQKRREKLEFITPFPIPSPTVL